MKKVLIVVAVTLASASASATELKFKEGKIRIKSPDETFTVFQQPMRIHSPQMVESFKKNKPNLQSNNDLVFFKGLKNVSVRKVYKYPDCSYVIGTETLYSGDHKIYVQPIHSDGLIEPIAEYKAGKSFNPVITAGKEGVIIKAYNLETKKIDQVEFSGCTDLDPGALPSD